MRSTFSSALFSFALVSTGVNGLVLSPRLLGGLNGLGVSEQCETAIKGLISSPATDCLNLRGIVAVVTTVENSSWIPPIDSWVGNMCAAEPCSTAELQGSLSQLTSGCSAELARIGVTADEVSSYAIEYYPKAREIACLRNANDSNELCVTSTLRQLEAALGGQPLNPARVVDGLPTLLNNQEETIRDFACTACAQAAYSIARDIIPAGTPRDRADGFIAEKCGAEFASGEIPSSIVISTGTLAVAALAATATPTSSGAMMIHGRSAIWVGMGSGAMAAIGGVAMVLLG